MMRPACSLVLLASLASAARGDVIFSTIEPGDGLDAGGGYFVNGPGPEMQSIGYQFSPMVGGVAGVYELGFYSVGLSGGTVTVRLYADSGGSPNLGVLLDTATFAVGANMESTLYAAPSGSNPILSAGTPYWIVTSLAESNAKSAWSFTDPVHYTLRFYGKVGSSAPTILDAGSAPVGAFRISTAAIAPEPGSLSLAAVGGAGLILAVRRRRRRA